MTLSWTRLVKICNLDCPIKKPSKVRWQLFTWWMGEGDSFITGLSDFWMIFLIIRAGDTSFSAHSFDEEDWETGIRAFSSS